MPRLVRVLAFQTVILLVLSCHDSNGPQCENTGLGGFGNNTEADQLAHPRSLISAIVIRFVESIISRLAKSKISNF